MPDRSTPPVIPRRLSPLVQTAAAIGASVVLFAYAARIEGMSYLLLWVGLVPWLAALERIERPLPAFLSGLAMCLSFTLVVFSWFARAMQGYTGAPLFLCVGVLSLLAPILQPQWLLFAWVRVLSRNTPWLGRAVLGASSYVAAEWLFPKLLGDTLGHGLQASVWQRQAADIAGAPGLTFVLVSANCFLLEGGLRLRGERSALSWVSVGAPWAGCVGLFLALNAYGAYRLAVLEARSPEQALSVVVVQPNLSHYSSMAAEMSTYDAVRLILDTHVSLSTAAMAKETKEPVDLLMWPETMYPTTFGAPKSEDGAAFDREIAAFVLRSGVALLFGSYDTDAKQERNAAFLLEPTSSKRTIFDVYQKRRLFPFTEKVPAWLESEHLRRWFPWMGTWSEGGGPPTIPLHRADGRQVLLAPLICFDAVDPSLALEAVRAGAEALVVLSNDAWFASGGGPHLHLVVSAFRSIETRRPQARSTTTGISAVITASGEILESLPLATAGTLRASLPLTEPHSTLMLAWGDWFGPFAFVLALGSGLFVKLSQKREQ